MMPKSLKTPEQMQWWFKNEVLRPTYKNQDERGHRENFGYKYSCPFPVMMYNPDEGKVVRESSQPCPIGKGTWCSQCWRWNRHQKQFGMSKRIYEAHKKTSLKSYLTTGLAYSMRSKPNPLKIVNPYARLR